MSERPKTLLGIINQFSKQSNKMEESRLVEAASTTSQIIANMVKLEVSADDVKSLQETFGTTYYNKYNNKDALYCEDCHPDDVTEFADDSTIYLDVAKDQPNINEVVIGGVRFEKMDGNKDYTIPENRYKRVSIGNNAFLYINVWKVIDGVLKIAVPYLVSLTNYETGICNIIAGGLPYDITTSEPLITTLKIKSAWVMKKAGYPTEIVAKGNTIRTKISHLTQGLCIVFGTADEDILDTDIMMYIIRDNMNVAITTPETVDGKSCSMLKYMLPWANAPIKKPIPTTVSHNMVVVPSKGLIEFNVITDAYIAKSNANL